jgi:hypothetical protein
MQNRINRSKARAFVLSDFTDLSGYDQILRTLRQMVGQKILIKIGQGIYVKAKKYDNGKTLPDGFIGDLAREALNKLGVKTANSSWWNMYNAEVSTQIPNGRVIAVAKRVRRKISNGGYSIFYEPMNKTYKSKWYNDPKRMSSWN